MKNVDTSGFPPKLPELAPDVKAALGILAAEYHHLDLNARKEDFQQQIEFLKFWFQNNPWIEWDEKSKTWWPTKLTLWLRIRRAIARLKAR